MQTLIPQPAAALAAPLFRKGPIRGSRLLGWIFRSGPLGWIRQFGLTFLGLSLFGIGLLMAIPAFFHPRQIYFMLGWDGLILLLVAFDLALLPRPGSLRVSRRFLDSPQLGQSTRIEVALQHEADSVLDVRLIDDLHPSLIAVPTLQRVQAFPREEVATTSTIFPRERGDFELGRVFLRYRGALRLVERWAAAHPLTAPINNEDHARPQRVRVFPAHDDSREKTQFYLLRARQIEMQKRKLRLRGVGREFESLRDYGPGDELRNISWTATARRGKLVTRQFTVERSQQVWIVLDAGRLSRTAFELRRPVLAGSPAAAVSVHETVFEREQSHLLSVTQLDQATTAATMLAQVIQSSGDKFAMMAYGRDVQQLLPPGNGASHLRLMIDLLSQTRSETAEADHLQAVARLKTTQRRRGLIVWITELVDSVGRPELVVAASELVRRHLVVLVLLKHPELEALAARTPVNADEMFHSAAAQEMLERRRETVAQLERQGVLIVEATAADMGMRAVSKYLEVKAEGLL